MSGQLPSGLGLAAAALGAAVAGLPWVAIAALVAAIPYVAVGVLLAVGAIRDRHIAARPARLRLERQ